MRAVSTLSALALVTAISSVQGFSNKAGPRRLGHIKRAEKLAKRSYSGTATYYDASGTGACGDTVSNSGSTVALNSAQYGSGDYCGQTITLTYNGVSATATVADECPGCGTNGLDLTESLFETFEDLDVGTFTVTWSFSSDSSSSSSAASTDSSSTETSASGASSTAASVDASSGSVSASASAASGFASSGGRGGSSASSSGNQSQQSAGASQSSGGRGNQGQGQSQGQNGGSNRGAQGH